MKNVNWQSRSGSSETEHATTEQPSTGRRRLLQLLAAAGSAVAVESMLRSKYGKASRFKTAFTPLSDVIRVRLIP